MCSFCAKNSWKVYVLCCSPFRDIPSNIGGDHGDVAPPPKKSLPPLKKMNFAPDVGAKFYARFVLKSAVNIEFCAPILFKKVEGVESLGRPPPKANFDSGMGAKLCACIMLKNTIYFWYCVPSLFDKRGGAQNSKLTALFGTR